MGEYARSGRGMLLSTGATMAVNLPFEPQVVKLTNYTAATTPASAGVPYASWDYDMGQGYAVTSVFGTAGTASPVTPYLTTAVLTANGISTFSAGISLQLGPQLAISGITKDSPAVVTTTNPHGYTTGQIVIFEGLYNTGGTTGMPQISGIPFQITKTGATTFTIPWNTNQSSYTVLSSPPMAFVQQVLFPFLYAPGVSVINSITPGTTTTITTTAPHNLSPGSQVAFRVETPWGTTQLNALNNPRYPGSPLYAFVTAVNNTTSVTVKLNSSNFSAFTTNPTVQQTPGLTPPEMLAVGDINSGGTVYSGGALYPSPMVNGVSTINGPAIVGSFVNNTSSGFILGTGVVGASTNVLYWEAYLYDYSIS